MTEVHLLVFFTECARQLAAKAVSYRLCTLHLELAFSMYRVALGGGGDQVYIDTVVIDTNIEVLVWPVHAEAPRLPDTHIHALKQWLVLSN